MVVNVVEEMGVRELREADRRAGSDAELAERLAAAYYGLDHAPDVADWFDARDTGLGTKMEVKSAHLSVGDDHPAEGRFRLWRSQLRSLTASRSSGSGTTWVVFVVFDGERPTVMRRMHARTARRIVEETVGWGPSGHEEWDVQAKVPLDAVFDAVE